MNSIFKKPPVVFFLALFVLVSCEKGVDEDALVVTQGLTFVSGDLVRISGSVVATGSVPISDHGFHISANQDFESAFIVSLGSRSVPGRFIGSFEGLTASTEYFVRAFMVVNGDSRFGDVIAFSTLGSESIEYAPTSAQVNRLITITGRNFTTDTKVFFGSVEGEIEEFKFESLIKVRAPQPVPGQFVVPIRVLSGGEELVFDENFEYQIGKWSTGSIYPGSKSLNRNAFFRANGKTYFGIDQGSAEPAFWSYDLGPDTWAEVEYDGALVRDPGNFEGGFLGGWTDFSFGFFFISREFWVINNNDEFVLEGMLPFAIQKPVIFRRDDNLYMFGGVGEYGELGEFGDFDGFKSEVWRYNFGDKSWTVINSTPTNISSLFPSFEYDGMMYFVDADKRLFRYNPSGNTWVQLSSFPGENVDSAIGQTVGDFAYVGLSGSELAMDEYDFINDKWRVKIPIPQSPQDVPLGWFTEGELLYILRSTKIGNDSPKIWVFDPNDL